MKQSNLAFVWFILVLLGVGVLKAGGGGKLVYKPTEQSYYLTDVQVSFVRPGLHLAIQKVVYNASNVTVTFQITDDAGQGLDRLGIQSPGPVSTSFVLARIKPGDTQYTNYFTSARTNTPTGAPVIDPAADSGGTYADLGNGVYTYTFGNKLPANFEADSTNTLGMYARRDLSAFDFPLNSLGTVANATLNFVPSGAPVTQVRDVVRTENCNQCHDPLAIHGGQRRDTQLCVLCHNPANTDPPTGNSLDFKVYIHKIHMGANLPSVRNQPLNVLGTSGSTVTTGIATGATQPPIAAGARIAGTKYILGRTDYSTVVWPQDVRNCTTCHQKGSQSDNWKDNPSRAACGSCHDDVNFDTGEGHPGGPMSDDSECTVCHKSDTGLEFDLSIAGVHTIPTESKQLAGLKINITGVTGTNPGSKPTVSFTVSDNKGNPVDATKLNALGFVLAGPTTDYTFPAGVAATENGLSAQPTSTGFTYTFSAAIPQNAQGTFAVGAQGYRLVNTPGSLVRPGFQVRENANNPIFYFGVGGAQITPRRTVVDVANCNVCHKKLALHGASRTNTQYCVMCHNPSVNDTQTPPQTVNFRTHIHRIHRGVDLENDWTINGTNNYNGVRFPGDLRDCAKCHVNNSNTLPLPNGLADANTPRLQYSPMKPTAQACLGCHDGDNAASHAFQMTAPFGESCTVCHEEGADFAVSKVHAR